jgi:hypothetical protein
LPSYIIQGLCLRTDLPLYGVGEFETAKVDVTVRFKDFPPDAFPPTERPPYFSDPATHQHFLRAWHSVDGFYLRYGDSPEFLISPSGSEIWVRWNEAIPFDDVCAYLTGPVVGFTLRIRGLLCLHASAIATGDWALAFMGPCGSGKSTLAASFGQAGFRVLTDDVLTLESEQSGFRVRPSLSRFKLWPDSARAIYGDENLFPRLVATDEKRIVQQAESAEKSGGILRVIYLLADRSGANSRPTVEKSNPADSLISVASHTYANYLLTPEMRKQEFQALQTLIAAVAVRRLTPKADLSALAELRETVLTDFEQTLRSNSTLS